MQKNAGLPAPGALGLLWLRGFALLAVALAAAVGLLGWWSGKWSVSLTAGAICGLGATAGFWLLYWGQKDTQKTLARAWPSLGGAILLRTFLPLGLGIWAQTHWDFLAQGGLMGQLVGIYLWGLLVETLLIVWLMWPVRSQAAPLTTKLPHGRPDPAH